MKAEVSIPVALATAALTWGIYQIALPTLADARRVEPNNGDLKSAENTALILAAGVSGGISILAHDTTPFVVGGLLAVALSWAHRKANHTDSTTQKLWNRDQYIGRRVAVQANG